MSYPYPLAGGSLHDLAHALRQLRRRHARERHDTPLTYRELAAKSGYSRSMIGDYLTGKALPPTDRLDVLVMLLGASPPERRAFATARDQVEERLRGQAGGARGYPSAEVPDLPFDLLLVAGLHDELALARYRVTRKSLQADIAAGPGAGPVQRRRDATLTWTVDLVNVSAGPLTEVELPLAGEVPLEDGELQVRVSSPGREARCSAQVREQPGFNPVIVVPLPRPGLAPGDSTSLQYSYTWPALAHAFSDRWFVITAGMKPGARVDVTLRYPQADAQSARAEIIRRGSGRWKAEAADVLPAYPGHYGGNWTVKMTRIVRADEYALLIRTARAEAVRLT